MNTAIEVRGLMANDLRATAAACASIEGDRRVAVLAGMARVLAPLAVVRAVATRLAADEKHGVVAGRPANHVGVSV